MVEIIGLMKGQQGNQVLLAKMGQAPDLIQQLFFGQFCDFDSSFVLRTRIQPHLMDSGHNWLNAVLQEHSNNSSANHSLAIRFLYLQYSLKQLVSY
jgi:hypothetical protein